MLYNNSKYTIARVCELCPLHRGAGIQKKILLSNRAGVRGGTSDGIEDIARTAAAKSEKYR